MQQALSIHRRTFTFLGVDHHPNDMPMTRGVIKAGKPPELTSLDALADAAEYLKALAHRHRLRIVQMLLRGPYTVGELAEACGIASHMASQHLRLMQRCGLLTKRLPKN